MSTRGVFLLPDPYTTPIQASLLPDDACASERAAVDERIESEWQSVVE